MTQNDINNKLDFDPVESVSLMLKNLLKREQDVLKRRFALHGKTRETLEQIGKEYEITRERVRQIEASGIRKIRNILNSEAEKLNLDKVEKKVSDILCEHGGIIREDILLKDMLNASNRDDNEIYRKNLLFVISYLLEEHERLLRQDEDLHFEPFWYLSELDIERLKNSINTIVNIFESHGNLLDLNELFGKASQHPDLSGYAEHFKKNSVEEINNIGGDERFKKFILSQLNISKKLDRNILGQWGMIDWNTVIPKRMNDKIYLVLRKENSPLHFSKIAEKINEVNFDKKLAYPATVHNELILDAKYVLVGRGVYALREWGYNDGTVLEVIVDILKKEADAMDKKDIVEKVLKQRMVRPATVALALNDKNLFKLTEEGKYVLAEN
ncbi:MAG: sigma factor-like helix-turn-helix DNA-binding protein [bacterium]